jgi:RimJ/RimL family protein N-acetyltransferase
MLTGEKIVLRSIHFEDWEKTINWRNDLFIKASTMSHPFPVTQEMEKAWYENVLKNKDNNYLPFTVVSKKDGEILGYFSLNNINWISRTAFVSGAIGDGQNFGKGLGREAVDLLLKYAFGYLNLQKVCAWVRTDHPAMKTWIGLGAVTEGTLHRHFFAEGTYHDVAFIAWFNNEV